MGPFEMVVAIVGITTVASLIKAKRGGRWKQRGGWQQDEDSELAQENRQLRGELHGLKERIQVLERLATDDESDARRLDREIEKLRDRPGVAAGHINAGRSADTISGE